jgi:hypothetical protein
MYVQCNSVRLMTQLTHGRNEVAQVKTHLETRVKALTAHAQALNHNGGSLCKSSSPAPKHHHIISN